MWGDCTAICVVWGDCTAICVVWGDCTAMCVVWGDCTAMSCIEVTVFSWTSLPYTRKDPTSKYI